MTRRSGLTVTVFLAVVLCIPCTLGANPAPQPIAGGAVTTKSPNEFIRMEAEEVTIRLGDRSYVVEGAYRMVNSGETTTEWVGFPKNRHEMHKSLSYQDFIQFEVWVDGKNVPFSRKDRQWRAGQVTFSGHTSTIIRVMYEVNYHVSFVMNAPLTAEYIVGTGSLWKGSIGKAIFTVDGSEIGGAKNFDAHLNIPRSHKLSSAQVIRFDVKDFKPERDATLLIEINGDRKAAAR
jgi:hypothetical protein